MLERATQLAQVDVDLEQPITDAGLQTFEIQDLIAFLVAAVLAIAGIVFFFMLVLGGLRWILSGGDKANTEAARNQITAALIGLIIVFSAWAIVTLVEQIFGFDILNFTIPSVVNPSSG